MTTTRAFAADISVDREARTIVATVNTLALDRYKTVVMPDGAQLANYRRNPIVLFNHGGGMLATADDALPIGRNLWIKSTKKSLVAKTEFPPPGHHALADKVFDLYDLGFLNAWSISWEPIETSRPTPDEIRKRPELVACETIYRTWDLLEYSCVTCPGNPEAVRAARARGLGLPGWPDPEPGPAPQPAAPPARVELPPLVGRSMEEVLKAVLRSIDLECKSEMTRAARDAHDRARGMF